MKQLKGTEAVCLLYKIVTKLLMNFKRWSIDYPFTVISNTTIMVYTIMVKSNQTNILRKDET